MDRHGNGSENREHLRSSESSTSSYNRSEVHVKHIPIIGAYKVQVKIGLEWSLEDTFNCLNGAAEYAKNHYPQNQWRIVDHNGTVIWASSPSFVELSDDLERFKKVEGWREHFARKKEERRLLREQEERNARAREEEEERNWRYSLRESAERRAVWALEATYNYILDEEGFYRSLEEGSDEIVDWVKEGF